MRRRLRRNNQTPKSVALLSAQRSWFKANNGINDRGPPKAGRMPFMPAVSLNQWSGALPTWSCFNRFFLLSFFFSVFAAACSAGSIFWLSTTSAVRTRAVGARFKLLSVGAGSKHGDLCNEQIRDSNERSNLSLRVLFAQAPFQTRSVAAKKFICGLAVQIQWLPSFFGKVSSLLFGGVHNQT